jgi:hypothetical protein
LVLVVPYIQATLDGPLLQNKNSIADRVGAAMRINWLSTWVDCDTTLDHNHMGIIEALTYSDPSKYVSPRENH